MFNSLFGFAFGLLCGFLLLAVGILRKLKTHDCTYDGAVKWIERKDSIDYAKTFLFRHPNGPAQSAIQKMYYLGFDSIHINANIMDSTCFVYKKDDPEGSPPAVKYRSSSVDASIVGALQMVELLVATPISKEESKSTNE
jgi:hypothetical protein